MLRANFIRVPAPGSPAWMTNAAQCLNAGLIRSYTSRSAPTMVASSPFAAAAAPPLTGASTTWMPCGFSASAKFDGSGVADGRVDRDDGSGLGVCRQLADDLTHLRVVEHGDVDDVGGGNVGDTVGQARALLGQRRHRLGPDVVNRYPARPFGHLRGHRRAHVAQPDVAELASACAVTSCIAESSVRRRH